MCQTSPNWIYDLVHVLHQWYRQTFSFFILFIWSLFYMNPSHAIKSIGISIFRTYLEYMTCFASQWLISDQAIVRWNLSRILTLQWKFLNQLSLICLFLILISMILNWLNFAYLCKISTFPSFSGALWREMWKKLQKESRLSLCGNFCDQLQRSLPTGYTLILPLLTRETFT